MTTINVVKQPDHMIEGENQAIKTDFLLTVSQIGTLQMLRVQVNANSEAIPTINTFLLPFIGGTRPPSDRIGGASGPPSSYSTGISLKVLQVSRPNLPLRYRTGKCMLFKLQLKINALTEETTQGFIERGGLGPGILPPP